MIQFDVARAIDRRKNSSRLITECSVDTSDGVKVADVAWASDAFIAEYGEATPYPKAPEICVGIVSPSNSRQEVEHKVELYLAKGALEVWVVTGNRQITFYAHTGQIPKSKLVAQLKF